VPLYLLAILRHYLAHAHARQRVAGLQLHVAGPGRIHQEPANKRQPQPAESFIMKKLQNAVEDESNSYQLPDSGRNLRRAIRALRDSPDDGAQHSPAIQRKTGNHVESA